METWQGKWNPSFSADVKTTNEQVISSLHSAAAVTRTTSTECWKALMWRAGIIVLQEWLIYETRLLFSTCPLDGHMLLRLFFCQSHPIRGPPTHRGGGATEITEPWWLFSISFCDDKKGRKKRLIILALHAGMLSQIMTELVLIMELLKEPVCAQRCQSPCWAQGNQNYMQEHNTDYQGFKCVIMFSLFYSFIPNGSLQPFFNDEGRVTVLM